MAAARLSYIDELQNKILQCLPNLSTEELSTVKNPLRNLIQRDFGGDGLKNTYSVLIEFLQSKSEKLKSLALQFLFSRDEYQEHKHLLYANTASQIAETIKINSGSSHYNLLSMSLILVANNRKSSLDRAVSILRDRNASNPALRNSQVQMIEFLESQHGFMKQLNANAIAFFLDELKRLDSMKPYQMNSR